MKIWHRILCFFGLINDSKSSDSQLVETSTFVEGEINEPEPQPYYPVFLHSQNDVESTYNYVQMRQDKGVMEDFFFDFCNFKLSIPPSNLLQIQVGGNSVTPDIAVVDEEKAVRIAIEIDEPYTLDNQGSLIPIHFIGCDEQREKTLLENGWSIIRFAEEQIVKEPESCIDYINDCIKAMNSSQLTTIKRWSKEDAELMIISKHRNSYLPIEFTDEVIRNKSSFRFRCLPISGIDLRGDEKYGKSEIILFERQFGGIGNNRIDSSIPEMCYIPKEIFWKKLQESDFGKIIKKYDEMKIQNRRLMLNPNLFCKGLYLQGFGAINQPYFNLKSKTDFEIICTEEAIQYHDNFLKIFEENYQKKKISLSRPPYPSKLSR